MMTQYFSLDFPLQFPPHLPTTFRNNPFKGPFCCSSPYFHLISHRLWPCFCIHTAISAYGLFAHPQGGGRRFSKLQYTSTCLHGIAFDDNDHFLQTSSYLYSRVIPQLMKIIRFRITFVSRNVIQMEKISSWNGPTDHICCFMLACASTKTFVSQSIFIS